MDDAPHIDRSIGRTLFGNNPAAYDEARPGYPTEVYEVLASRCGLGASSKVFEVGAGTGQATEPIARVGARVTALEPDPELAGLLADKMGRRFPAVSIDVASFEDDPLPAASFDLGIAATSFHWVNPTPGLRKAHRLLVPGGWWAMWWNVFMDPTRPDPFYEATSRLLEPLKQSPGAGATGSPSFALDIERRKEELDAAGLSNTEVEVIRWIVEMDAAQTRALYATFSPILRLSAGDQRKALDAIAAVVEDHFEGRVERPFQTILYTSQRE